MNLKKSIRIISVILLLAVLLSFFFIESFNEFAKHAYDILSSGDRQRISEWVSQFGAWGPILVVIAMVVQMFLIVIPSPLLMVVAVLAYGSWWGSLLAYASVFLASTVGYWIGYGAGSPLIDKLLGQKKRKKTAQYVDAYGVWAVILARVSPFLSNDAISFIGGLINMGYFKFMLATTIGIIPLITLIAILGENQGSLKAGLYWISGITLLIFIGYIIYRNQPKLRHKLKEKIESH